MDPELLEPEKHVLSTLEADGSRRWLKPRLSKGRLLVARRVVAYGLIALYAILPHIRIGGRPFVLLDVAARRFTIFGYTFLPTDTLLLALLMVGGLLGFFLATALVGRIWCGWACPQTVYLEFLFRPIERLIEGTSGRGGKARKPPSGARIALKYVIYFLLALFLANTFLAYFVGTEALAVWMTSSPVEHPGGFLLVVVMTGAIMFDFAYFREQMCIITCPYGRLQSVLLDDSSLIIAYDAQRGEPRGKKRKKLPVADQPPQGDCVDCGLCVATCPTGIDIRKGLQMECVNCTQCIDACNGVMAKIGRAPDLIRYSSQRADRGDRRRLLRPRVIIYPAIIGLIATLFFVTLAGKTSFEAVVLRNAGDPYSLTEAQEVRNVLRLKLTNRTDEVQQFTVEVVQPAGVRLEGAEQGLSVDPRADETFPFSVLGEPEQYVRSRGRLELELRVTSDTGDQRTIEGTLVGPSTLPRPSAS